MAPDVEQDSAIAGSRSPACRRSRRDARTLAESRAPCPKNRGPALSVETVIGIRQASCSSSMSRNRSQEDFEMAVQDCDDELLAALRRRDGSAVDRLLDAHAEPAYGLAFRITGNAHDAEQIVLHAFSSVIRQVATI